MMEEKEIRDRIATLIKRRKTEGLLVTQEVEIMNLKKELLKYVE